MAHSFISRFARPVLAAALLACAVQAAVAHGAEDDADFDLDAALEDTREATRAFRHLAAAQNAGYTVLVQDQAGKTCIDQSGQGAMGFHYANPQLLADPAVDALRPEVLMYARQRNGRLALVGMEYIVDQRTWDALHPQPPQLFGHPFHLVRDGNRYGLPAFYELHLWLWKRNPNGLFNDWNPAVRCQ
jgi:hypothetical protein